MSESNDELATFGPQLFSQGLSRLNIVSVSNLLRVDCG